MWNLFITKNLYSKGTNEPRNIRENGSAFGEYPVDDSVQAEPHKPGNPVATTTDAEAAAHHHRPPHLHHLQHGEVPQDSIHRQEVDDAVAVNHRSGGFTFAEKREPVRRQLRVAQQHSKRQKLDSQRQNIAAGPAESAKEPQLASGAQQPEVATWRHKANFETVLDTWFIYDEAVSKFRVVSLNFLISIYFMCVFKSFSCNWVPG